ncbi:Hypothetical predicted protein [Pelobates cultripes]|uniref:Uncharacterized protein n=1 Tax=Pelobates cultripes TaxID=61616 RepID=A0AAD1SI49_PELCU|nr:Hypothetical predicted protein [Pelobates cultripes]
MSFKFIFNTYNGEKTDRSAITTVERTVERMATKTAETGSDVSAEKEETEIRMRLGTQGISVTMENTRENPSIDSCFYKRRKVFKAGEEVQENITEFNQLKKPPGETRSGKRSEH